MMHQGVALPISDIRPDENIESEIFPRELTKEAQNKDVFTPPNHQQMRFMGQEDEHLKRRGRRPPGPEEGDHGFFITDVAQENAIQEENESDQEQQPNAEEPRQDQQPGDREAAEQQPNADLAAEDEDDDEFDFGKAKMDFFKKRAREILQNDNEMEYEGNPMPLAGAYKNLKHAVKNPSTVYTKLESKPGYMKMTFSQGRQAPAAGKYLELGKQMEIAKSAQ